MPARVPRLRLKFFAFAPMIGNTLRQRESWSLFVWHGCHCARPEALGARWRGPMLLPSILRYRVDCVAFALLVLAAGWFCLRLVASRKSEAGYPFIVWSLLTLLGAFIVGGCALAEWAGAHRRTALIAVFSGFGPTYAYELQQLGHARVTLATAPDDPTYLALVEAEKNWLRLNPLVADIYTFRRAPDGRFRFIVDSETDYDRDGLITGEREQRTVIGEIYPEATPDFAAAARGETRFDTTLVPDRWGLWVSSLTPIYDDQGRVEAVVGIDYPGVEWLTAILGSRAIALAVTAVIVAILLASMTVASLLRAEIRQRRQAQQALLQDKDALDTLNRSKTEFLAVMSHEIRTPLTAMMGFASMLDDTTLDRTQRRYLQTILSACQRLVGMINDMSDVPKLEQGRLTLACEPMRPLGAIKEAVDLLTARAMSKGLALRFEHNLSADLTLQGDAPRLQQILLNLLTNAVKFTDKGTIVVSARWQAIPGEPPSGALAVSVTDTGIGIPPVKLGRLFEMFSQIDPDQGRHRGGSGIGLAICQRLVDLMGGELEVHSEPGKGTRFSFSLPCVLAPSIEDSVTPTLLFPTTPPPPPHILVVDDDRLNREILRTLLERNGFEVTLATGGTAALSLCAQRSFAAIFLDVDMPGMDGATTALQIRAHGSTNARVPIIAVTAVTAKGTLDRCLAAGMNEYLTKPIYMPAALSTLRAVLGVAHAAS